VGQGHAINPPGNPGSSRPKLQTTCTRNRFATGSHTLWTSCQEANLRADTNPPKENSLSPAKTQSYWPCNEPTCWSLRITL
jgi:hypothetical protein